MTLTVWALRMSGALRNLVSKVGGLVFVCFVLPGEGARDRRQAREREDRCSNSTNRKNKGQEMINRLGRIVVS